MLGFHFHPIVGHYSVDDRQLYPLMETINELGVPVLIDVGTTGMGAGTPGGLGGVIRNAHPSAIDRLAADLDELTRRVETEHKVIPESADIAGLMRVLSMPVDGVTIRDQTFTTGQPKEAVVGGDLTAMATPLTIDMVARFDSIFALIQAAESLDRLLRVESLNMVCEHPEGEDELFASASVSLDVIYDPPGAREDR